MRKAFWSIAVVVVGLLLVVWSMGERGAKVDTALSRTADVRQFVEERGKTRLTQTYLITMPYDGRIAAINLLEGDMVHQGDIVAHLVRADLELAKQEAQAAVDRLEASIRENDDITVENTALKQAKQFVQSMDRTVEAAAARVLSGEAKLGFAKKTLGRVTRLQQTGANTEEDLDLSQLREVESSVDYQQDKLVHSAMLSMQSATALVPHMVQQYIARKSLARDVLEKQLAEALVRLEQAKLDLQRGVMRSPINGVVLTRHGSNERPLARGTVLLTLGRLEDLEIESDILSEDAVRVKKGQRVDVFGSTIGNKPVTGEVKRLFPAGFTKISSLGVEQQRVRVIIGFSPDVLQTLLQQHRLGVDYRVRVRIITDESSGTLAIERTALFRGAEAKPMVFVVRHGKAKRVEVETGLMNDQLVEIRSGIKEGESVILTPDSNLKEGSRVVLQ